MGGLSLLLAMFGVWALACAVIGAVLLRRAPALTLSLGGAVLGALVGSWIGGSDGPAEVPAYTAMGASIGAVLAGGLGLLSTHAQPPSAPLRRAGLLLLAAVPPIAVTFAGLLRMACPLYVTGRDAGVCTYQDVDVLGGWSSGVIVAFAFDAVFVASLLLFSARQARRAEVASREERRTRR